MVGQRVDGLLWGLIMEVVGCGSGWSWRWLLVAVVGHVGGWLWQWLVMKVVGCGSGWS